MNLHYSQTALNEIVEQIEFHYLMNLHYSQTILYNYILCVQFHYLMNLHYSQTAPRPNRMS